MNPEVIKGRQFKPHLLVSSAAPTLTCLPNPRASAWRSVRKITAILNSLPPQSHKTVDEISITAGHS